MKNTILLAAIIAVVAILATKKSGKDTPTPLVETEIKVHSGGAVSTRDTYPDGTVRCTFEPPGQKAVLTDCSDFDK